MSTQPTVADLLKSQKPLEAMNAEEKRARYKLLKSKMGRSRLAVEGKKELHYFWAGLEDQHEMARLEGLGYFIVREPNAADVMAGKTKGQINANGLRSDGTYVVGDVILTACPLEVYEFIMLANSERHEEMALGAQRDFQTEATQLAVPVFDHSK
jgi:hypothetical protein